MSVTGQKLLSVGEAARELNELECRVRRVMRQGRAYVTTVGRNRGIAPEDLPLLAADLKAAGYSPVIPVEGRTAPVGA